MTVLDKPRFRNAPPTPSPTPWVVEDLAAGTFRVAAGVVWSDISRGMHREHCGQPSRADDELQMRAFWRQWQRLMSVRGPN